MKTIIVDDEQKSHDVLIRLLNEFHPKIEYVASGFNMKEGLSLISTHSPDLVFLDIEMPDGTGFDLLNQISRPTFSVIFITAHNEYAITAIHFGALDYLLKPVSPDLLKTALERAREKKEANQRIEQMRMAIETFEKLTQKRLPSRMLVSTMEGMHYIPIEDIIRLEAQTNCTEIFYKGAKKRLVASVNLGAYEEQFAPYSQFMRVHKSHIVNLKEVQTYIRGENNLVLSDGTEIPVSRDNRDELLNGLKDL